MTEQEIQFALDNLSSDALDKGLGQPKFALQFEDNHTIYTTGRWLKDGLQEFHHCKSAFTKTAAEGLDSMRAQLAVVKPKAEREREEYLRKIAEAVEYGRTINIDQALINPLLEQMKKLSTNIIEARPMGEILNDEIPF